MSDFFQTVRQWYGLKNAIAALQAEEKELREALFAGCFPQAVEGANTLVFPQGPDDLPAGTKLIGTRKINRTVLTKEWDKVGKPTREKLLGTGAIVIKPTLALAEFRKLQGEELALVNRFIEVKPGLPSLDLKLPKEE